LERYEVEAVFAGHVHSFFYNRYGSTDIYCLPAVGFTRVDLSAVLPVDDRKMGFFVVEVNSTGHRTNFVSTGAHTPRAAEGKSHDLKLILSDREDSASVGVWLNYDWAQRSRYPTTGNDQFVRKWIRNDYPILALWEAGIKALRVPITDLRDSQLQKRMQELVCNGHKFFIYSVGPPKAGVRKYSS
jgi:hypothetical protein